MYRPTVRYDNIYRTYVDGLFNATKLDRNQILRCALFTAVRNDQFIALMNHYKKEDVPLPSPLWNHSSHRLWLEQGAIREEDGGSKYDYSERKGTSSKSIEVSRATRVSQSMSGTPSSPTRQHSSINEKEQQDRRHQPIKRRKRTFPSLQLSNNGGIKLDFR